MKPQTLTLKERTDKEFQRNPNLRKIVEAIKPFGIGTANTIMVTTQLGHKAVNIGLAKLVKLGLIAKLDSAGRIEIAREGRPEKPYIFTIFAPDVLDELGHKGVQALDLDGSLDVSHRLCIALVGCHAITPPEVEKVFRYGDGKFMRFDLVSPQDGNPCKRIVEIEQALKSNNKSRAFAKLRGISDAIAAHPKELDDEALIIFNLSDDALRGTIKVWQKALKDAGTLSCTIRYCTLRNFLKAPYIDAIADLPILIPHEGQSKEVESEEDGEVTPFLAPFTADEIGEILAGMRQAAQSAPTRMIIPEQEKRRLADFFAIMQVIHDGDFGKDGGTSTFSLYPSTSLNRLKTFLHLGKNRTLKSRMRRGLKEVRKRQSGVTLYQDAISKFVWGTFLRQFGLGRGGPLKIYIMVPEVGGKNTEIGFEIQLHLDNDLGLNIPSESLAALDWVLSAFLLYPEELGLTEPGRD
jgi:hypothetical protein